MKAAGKDTDLFAEALHARGGIAALPEHVGRGVNDLRLRK
jgi:hypothetical protein